MTHPVDTGPRLYFPALDGLRFLAFLLVFARHTLGPQDNSMVAFAVEFGWSGVDLFFLLSSFLFFAMLSAENDKNGQINFRFFYLRRILRIIPLYFLYIAIVWSIGYAYGTPGNTIWSLLAYLTFTINLLWGWTSERWSFFMGNHLWTIAYEEQIYLVLPFIIAAIIGTKGRLKIALAALLVAACISAWLRWYITSHGLMVSENTVYMTPFLRAETVIAGIICGMAWASDIYKRVPSWVYGIVTLLIIVSLWLYTREYGFSQFNHRNGLIVYPILALLFSALLLYCLSEESYLARILALGPIAYLGKISYGLYIWHFFIARWIPPRVAKYFELDVTYGLMFVIGLVLTILVAAASYHLYERRFIRLKDRFTFVRNRPA
ncbi:acyltransferase [Aquibium sp. LZ166]|uniref:Acyltransferase n=1 Tax=Aquibium pacificus TaxID=3153579 RepID=A0ABV3STV8_9HYPH